MRFGWLMVAAAMVCAMPAGAQTYVQYEARGTGVKSSQYNGPVTYTSGDLAFDFVLPTTGYSYTGVGQGQIGLEGFTTTLQNNTLSFSANSGSYNTYLFNTAINLSALAATFADIPAASTVTGSVDISYPNPFGGTSYSGTVTSLVRVGTVSGFLAPFASVVPEPETWAMMIAGFGLAGAALRRRRAGYSKSVAFA